MGRWDEVIYLLSFQSVRYSQKIRELRRRSPAQEALKKAGIKALHADSRCLGADRSSIIFGLGLSADRGSSRRQNPALPPVFVDFGAENQRPTAFWSFDGPPLQGFREITVTSISTLRSLAISQPGRWLLLTQDHPFAQNPGNTRRASSSATTPGQQRQVGNVRSQLARGPAGLPQAARRNMRAPAAEHRAPAALPATACPAVQEAPR